MNNKQDIHILVVDDIEANRDLFSRHLQRVGYQVALATGGVQALEMVASTSFDLILLDIMMPEMDGFTVLESLRKHYSISQLPVIIISAIYDSKRLLKHWILALMIISPNLLTEK
jgi:CheY-like chemotaxis protein